MKFSSTTLKLTNYPWVCLGLMLFVLAGCGSDDESSGYIKFYNASTNAPGVYLTVDEDLDNDDDDEVELTYSAVEFAEVSANNELDTGSYYVELAWQDEESSDRSDLEMVYQEQLSINSDSITFLAMTGDIRDPEVLKFDIAVVDDDDDDDDDLFNLRFLNLHPDYQYVDVYMSADNETFNEAVFVTSSSYTELSENIKMDQDQYIFYITEAGSDEVIYTSTDQSYTTVSQYVIVLRENVGVGSSPFAIDSIGTNGVTLLNDVDSEASFGFYNGVDESDYLPNYRGYMNIDVKLNDDSEVLIEGLATGEFSTSTTTANGDYGFDVLDTYTEDTFISDALLSLEENADSTIFIYSKVDPIDDDEDDDIDENSDGVVDGYEATIKSLTITKSNSSSIYSHGIKVVNLSDSDDFSRVTFYFVLSDEIISTAESKLSVLETSSGSVSLLNNTYDIFAIATIDGTDVIMDSLTMTLDEDSVEQFLIFAENESMPSGYEMTLVNQKSDE
ncbi:DUF4397 domain-containing protein [Alteromonas sp. M12]|uniref:DUF4397 domain-containing protein n=1 Tax=Alteromonas sp. M12 TaxID=3135644 RepID=UPI00319E31BA